MAEEKASRAPLSNKSGITNATKKRTVSAKYDRNASPTKSVSIGSYMKQSGILKGKKQRPKTADRFSNVYDPGRNRMASPQY